MASSNVDFYEKIKQLQDVQFDSEERRLKLEQQLNVYAKSDQRLARLKAVQLQNYWKKLCENEKKSNWRNEQLLKDFDRVESQMESLSTRTERLRTMKKQYEEYIERMYPDWKLKIQGQRQRQNQPPVTGVVTAGTGLSQGLTGMLSRQSLNKSGISLPNLHLQQNGNHPPTISTMPQHTQPKPVKQGHTKHTTGLPTQPAAIPQPNNIYQTAGTYSTGSSMPYNPPTIPPIDLEALNTNPTNPRPAQNPYLMDTTINSTLQTVSSLPTGVSMTSTHGELMRAYSSASQEHTMKATDEEEEEEEQVVTSPKVTVRKRGEGQSETYVLNGAAGDNDKNWSPEPKHNHKGRTDEDSDIGTDVSLPLSGSPDVSARQHGTPRSARSHGSNKSQGSGKSSPRRAPVPQPVHSQVSHQESVEDRSVYPEADITLEGLYNLLEVVQDALGTSRNLMEFYRAQRPAPSVTKDIVHNANKGGTLSHLDPVSVSMVVLDQLPLVVTNCENNCLIPDEFLFSVPANLNKDVVRSRVHRTCQVFWDHMYDHLTLIVKHKVMTPGETAEYFGPLLIADDSPYEESAKRVLKALLDDLPADPLSPGSTTTFEESLPQPVQHAKSVPSVDSDAILVPSAATLESEPAEEELETSDDDFFSKPVPNEGITLSTGSLTQTDAYRRMLGDTISSQKSAPVVDTDDSDEDDLEKMLGLSRSGPRMSFHPEATSTMIGTGNTEPDSLLNTQSKEEEISEASSPAISGGGYVPSAMGQTGASTMSQASNKSSKKPAFMYTGDSDTDEDIAIQQRGKKSDDDSDFYS